MLEPFVTCPLCGLEFHATDTVCQHGCPLRSACNLTRCPVCDYEFPDLPQCVSWYENVVRWLRRDHEPVRQGAPCPDRGDPVLTVRELTSGERAEVVHLADDTPVRSNALAVFGLTPGTEVTLVQRHPSFVVQVGETLLALDSDVAASIVVRRGAAAA
jgi:Fe2+ transport system protein FeoA